MSFIRSADGRVKRIGSGGGGWRSLPLKLKPLVSVPSIQENITYTTVAAAQHRQI